MISHIFNNRRHYKDRVFSQLSESTSHKIIDKNVDLDIKLIDKYNSCFTKETKKYLKKVN